MHRAWAHDRGGAYGGDSGMSMAHGGGIGADG